MFLYLASLCNLVRLGVELYQKCHDGDIFVSETSVCLNEIIWLLP
jgi:hypothetical protein